MTKIRVLVVDDSVVVRKVLSLIITQDPELELAGTAPTASVGIQKIDQTNPDVVVMDVEMPGMNGIEATARIRQGWPRLPILMCSTLTERGADVTVRALAAGAADYVAKPASVANGDDTLEAFRSDFVAKVKALAVKVVLPPVPALGAGVSVSPPASPGRRTGLEMPSVLLLGSSTGGPNALSTVFEKLPGDLPVPLLLVQHMPPLFTRLLAERLTATTRVKVAEAVHGERVEPGRAYVAPGGFHMLVVREGTAVRIALNQEAPECSCRPAVDVLFRSAAKVYGSGCVAAVLTGMGQDGARGAREIAQVGGFVAVQDAASCVIPSMPGAVLAAGAANEVVTLADMGSFLAAKVARARFGAFARSA